jgi:pimeloyl-ACP methyl ester carboxylesterase
MAQGLDWPVAPFHEGYVEADGFRIRYVEAGHGHTVVALDSAMWSLSKLHHALAQKYHIFAFEIPGLGTSPPNARSKSLKELADTVAQGVAKVVADNYTLMGTSFGANVALWYTLQAPHQVEALVMISPTCILPKGGPMTHKPEESAEWLFSRPDNAQGFSPADPSVLSKEQALARRLTVGTHYAEAEGKLGEIQCATLVVFGQKDRMVAPEAARVYREKIANCNVSIVYDAGHLIVAERPEALINVVSDFVERRETFVVSRQSGVINP